MSESEWFYAQDAQGSVGKCMRLDDYEKLERELAEWKARAERAETNIKREQDNFLAMIRNRVDSIYAAQAAKEAEDETSFSELDIDPLTHPSYQNTPQAGAMTGTSFEGLKRPSSLDQSHPRNPSEDTASVVGRVGESSGDLRVAGASPLSTAAPDADAQEVK